MRHEVIGHIRIAGQSAVHIRRCTTIAAIERYLVRHGRKGALPVIIDRFAAGIHFVTVQ